MQIAVPSSAATANKEHIAYPTPFPIVLLKKPNKISCKKAETTCNLSLIALRQTNTNTNTHSLLPAQHSQFFLPFMTLN